MNRLVIAGFGLALAVAAPLLAGAQPAAAPAPKAVAPAAAPHVTGATAIWTHVPSAAEIAAVYPAAAKAAGVAGTVVLHCTATAEGGLNTCRVAEETPKDMGFGEAAMKLAPVIRLAAKTTEGVDTAGARIGAPAIDFKP